MFTRAPPSILILSLHHLICRPLSSCFIAVPYRYLLYTYWPVRFINCIITTINHCNQHITLILLPFTPSLGDFIAYTCLVLSVLAFCCLYLLFFALPQSFFGFSPSPSPMSLFPLNFAPLPPFICLVRSLLPSFTSSSLFFR